ncbi:hypothetical protein MMC07_004180 [Pseudocyphellaria aurata]|nr:hypothetical protein [Pseudocyphellaria aurata]
MAALPQDTIDIKPQTLTLNGFTLWDIPATVNRLTIVIRLAEMWNCAENYSFIADDLLDHCQAGSTRNQLALLLKYYSHGLRRALNNIPDDDLCLYIKQMTKNCLNKIDTALIACGILLPVLPEKDGEIFEIPNASVIELLVKSRFENIEVRQPYTLNMFKKMIRRLHIWKQTNARDPSGMPS